MRELKKPRVFPRGSSRHPNDDRPLALLNGRPGRFIFEAGPPAGMPKMDVHPFRPPIRIWRIDRTQTQIIHEPDDAVPTLEQREGASKVRRREPAEHDMQRIRRHRALPAISPTTGA